MNRYTINLLDLPSEILLIILKKLDNIDVLYSFFDINNQRLNNILRENTFTNTLNFALTTSTDDILLLSNQILDRFCINILPKIHYNVKSLILHSSSMERILLASDYPNLTELKIFNFDEKIASLYFTVETPFRHIFQHEITDLILVFENDFDEESCEHYTKNVYGLILKFFENLNHLSIIGESHPNIVPPLVLRDLPLATCYSSTLYKLFIHVMCFDDLLRLLDGRLKNLNTLNVAIMEQFYYEPIVYNMNDLPDLKCFYLKCYCEYDIYDDQVLPLLRRMSNIEVLKLHLTFMKQTTLIDGKDIYNEIIVHMSRLQTFNFYFCIFIPWVHLTHPLSKNDILETFSNIIYQQVDCLINYRFYEVKYQLFSLPFTFDDLSYVDNTFPNVIFSYVTKLLVDDDSPFEHEFFIRIALSFPLLKELRVFNYKPQSRMLNELTSDDNQSYSAIIEFPYLYFLDLSMSHYNYVEQFLNDRKTHLPHLRKLKVLLRCLKVATKNFSQRKGTRFNCMKVKQLNIGRKITGQSEDFYRYFPSL